MRQKVHGIKPFVFIRMPFPYQRGAERGEVMILCWALSGAIRAAIAEMAAVAGPLLPFVPPFTSPPDLLPRGKGDGCRSQSAVFLIVPLIGQFRPPDRESVQRADPVIGTIWTAVAFAGLLHRHDPFMALAAFPPDLFAGSCRHIGRGERTVPLGVPHGF